METQQRRTNIRQAPTLEIRNGNIDLRSVSEAYSAPASSCSDSIFVGAIKYLVAWLLLLFVAMSIAVMSFPPSMLGLCVEIMLPMVLSSVIVVVYYKKKKEL